LLRAVCLASRAACGAWAEPGRGDQQHPHRAGSGLSSPLVRAVTGVCFGRLVCPRGAGPRQGSPGASSRYPAALCSEHVKPHRGLHCRQSSRPGAGWHQHQSRLTAAWADTGTTALPTVLTCFSH